MASRRRTSDRSDIERTQTAGSNSNHAAPSFGIGRSTMVDSIRKTISKYMKRKTEPDKTFFCDEDLVRIEQDVWELLKREECPEVCIDKICKQCLKVIAVIIWIDAYDTSRKLHEVLMGELNTSPQITDEDLYSLDETTVSFLSGPLKQKFLKDRWIFNPVKIVEDNSKQTIIWPGPLQRLPWLEELPGIGVGGYGTVMKVKIPRGYHVEYRSGENAPSINQGDKSIACKIIESPQASQDFEKEIKTLSILKQSITSHEGIVKHIGFLVLEHQYFILLPLALGDLELFLNDGKNEDKELKFEYKDPFMEMIRDVSVRRLITESFNLASAIEWLHSRLEVPGHSDLSCIHMDLKPENVLIMPDGIWKISDFGISVINSRSESQSMEISSIGDAFGLLRSKCRPQRAPGRYQAPEIQKSTPTVGKKSDVWSYACIFSVVLASAIGGGELVTQFHERRKIVQGSDGSTTLTNDYFYSIDNTKPPGSALPYITRREALEWFDETGREYSDQGEWIHESFSIIKKYLVVDPAQRPGIEKFVQELRSLSQHPSIPDEPRPLTFLPAPPRQSSSGSENGFTPKTSNGSTSSIRSLDLTPWPKPPWKTLLLDSMGSNFSLHGPVPHEGASTAGENFTVALSPFGNRAAWIKDNEVYALDFSLSHGRFLSNRDVIYLPDPIKWSKFAMNERFFTAVGNTQSSTVTYLHDRDRPRSPYRFNASLIPTLSWVDVSPQGRVLLVSEDRLEIVRLENIDSAIDPIETEHLVYEEIPHPSVIEEGRHMFEYATFSPTGERIFAWSWGNDKDEFHAWYSSPGGQWSYQYVYYPSLRYGSKANYITLLPFYEIPGCVMKSRDDDFFSATMPENHSERQAERQLTHINTVILATVFMDSWLITVERRRWAMPNSRKRYIKRYMISTGHSDDVTRYINKDGHEIGKFKNGSIDTNSAMRIFYRNSYMVIVICNSDGTMVTAQLTNGTG